MPDGGVPRELHSSLIFAAPAANAWLRGLSIPVVALHYRYEPLTALNLIRRLSRLYGAVNVEQFVPENVLASAGETYGGGRPARSVAALLRKPRAAKSLDGLRQEGNSAPPCAPRRPSPPLDSTPPAPPANKESPKEGRASSRG